MRGQKLRRSRATREVLAVRLRGQQSNTATMVIVLVLIVALLVAGYVLLIAPR